MKLDIQSIQATDMERIAQFENRRLNDSTMNSEDRIFATWSARWRPESLESYLKIGWSYLIQTNDGELAGYFLAQPLLFFQGHAQSLWIEHLSHSTLQARDELTDFAYRLAREKHFQRVFFPSSALNSLKPLQAEVWSPDTFVVKTTKG